MKINSIIINENACVYYNQIQNENQNEKQKQINTHTDNIYIKKSTNLTPTHTHKQTLCQFTYANTYPRLTYY